MKRTIKQTKNNIFCNAAWNVYGFLYFLFLTALKPNRAWNVSVIPAYSKLPKDAQVITFGITLSLTGNPSYSSLGPGILNSLDMWVWWVNEKHGGLQFGGKNYYVRLKWMDNAGNATNVAQMTKYLICTEGVNFLFGPYSSTLTAIAAEVTESKSVIMLGAGSATTSVFSGKRFLFSPLSPATSVMPLAIKTLVLRGARTVVNIVQGLVFTIAAGEAVHSSIVGMQGHTEGIRIIHQAHLSAAPTQQEIISLVHNLTNLIEKTDILVGCVYASVCTMLLQAFKEYGYSPSAMVFSLCVDDPGYLPTFGLDDSRFVLGAVQWNAMMPLTDDLTGWTAKQFDDLYRSRYSNMSLAYVAASYFAAGEALVEALKKSPTLYSMDVAFALSRLSLNTFYGKIQFDGNGQNTQDYSYIQYDKNTQLQIVIPDTLATAPLIYPMPSFSFRDCVVEFGPTSCKCFPDGCPKCTLNSYSFNVSECASNRNTRMITYFKSEDCEGGTPFPSSIPIECSYIPFASPTAITVQIVSYLGGFLAFCFLVWCVRQRKTKLLKASQPAFCILMCAGGLVCALSPLSLLGPMSTEKCAVRPWLFYIPFTLMMGSLFVKTFRIWRIFGNKKLIKVKFTVLDSLKMLGVVMAVVIVTLGVWYILSAPKLISTFIQVTNVGDVSHTTCSSFQMFVMILVFFEVTLVALCCYFSFQNRKVNENFSETQYIMISVYSIAFIFGITNIVAMQNVPLSLRVLMRGIGASLSCLVALCALFIPKILIQHYHILGDPANLMTSTSTALRTVNNCPVSPNDIDQHNIKLISVNQVSGNSKQNRNARIRKSYTSQSCTGNEHGKRTRPSIDDDSKLPENLLESMDELIHLLNSKLPSSERVTLQDFINQKVGDGLLPKRESISLDISSGQY